MSQGKCSQCGTETGIKKDGDLWKHKTPDGVPCDNVSTAGTNHEVAAAPMTFSAETVINKPRGLTIDVAGVDTPKREKETAPSPKKTKNVFVFEMTVDETNPYLGDKDWEASNKVLAFKKAKDAGKRPYGEPVLAHTETVGARRVLRYEVPVE